MLGYVIAFVLGFVFCKYLPGLKKRQFSYTCSHLDEVTGPAYREFKRDVLAKIQDEKSYFSELRERNAIKILEIGVGAGTNFKFYPEGCHVIAIDPNPFFQKYYNENRSKFPQIKSEEIIVAKGENMSMVADNSVDVVVVTLVLCSVDSVEEILKEILRVLAPGGKFYFVEHITEWDTENHSTRATLQNLLTKSMIWPALYDGCEFKRDTLEKIEQAGFSVVDAKKVYAPITHSVVRIINPHVVGTATK